MNAPTKPKLKIRKYRAEDREQVRTICFETGYLGDTIAPIYSDRESFADMFSGYYTDVEPETAFVVVSEADDDTVKGYCLGCADTRKAWDPGKVGLKHALLRGLIFRPGTAGFLFRTIADVIRDGGVHRTKVDFDKYPAHMHTNLLPDARGGIGLRLHGALIDDLRARGIRGAHTEISAENARTLAIAQKLGYKPLGEKFPVPGLRDPQGKRMHGMILGLDIDQVRTFSS